MSNINDVAGPSGQSHTPPVIQRKGKNAPRSRSGCLVCRARRIRCDESRPECAKCTKYGSECVYPQKKPFDQSKTRRVRSTTSVTSAPSEPPNPPTVTAHSLLFDDGETSIDALMALCRMTKMGAFFSDPEQAPPNFLTALFTNEDEMKAFHHCTTYTLSILVVREDQNPWIGLVVPLFVFPDDHRHLSTEGLKYSILAMGSVHLAYLHGRTGGKGVPQCQHYTALAATFRNKAVQYLRAAREVPTEAASDAYLAGLLMLLSHDIFATETSWREPWIACCEAVRLRQNHGFQWTTPLDKVLSHHACLLDWAVSLSSVIPHRLPQVAVPVEAISIELVEADHEAFEDTTGFKRSILQLSTRVVRLAADTVFRSRAPVHSEGTVDLIGVASHPHIAGSTEIATSLTSLTRWREEHVHATWTERTRIGSLALWNATNIIVRYGLLGAPLEDGSVQSAALDILNLCIEAGDKIEYLNWPLVVAGSVITDVATRDRLRAIVASFAYQCCEEIVVISRVLESMWDRLDGGRGGRLMDWQEVLLELGKPVLLG